MGDIGSPHTPTSPLSHVLREVEEGFEEGGKERTRKERRKEKKKRGGAEEGVEGSQKNKKWGEPKSGGEKKRHYKEKVNQ